MHITYMSLIFILMVCYHCNGNTRKTVEYGDHVHPFHYTDKKKNKKRTVRLYKKKNIERIVAYDLSMFKRLHERNESNHPIEIKKGTFAYIKKWIKVKGGLISYKYGKGTLFNYNSAYSPLYKEALIWKCKGYGVAYKYSKDAISFESAITVDKKVDGSLHSTFQIIKPQFKGKIITGFSSYKNEKKDNTFTLGSEIEYSHSSVKIHLGVKDKIYTNFTKESVISKRKQSFLFEFLYDQYKMLKVSGSAYLAKEEKKTIKINKNVGIECLFYLPKYFGFAGGYELNDKNEKFTSFPSYKFIVHNKKLKLTCKLASRVPLLRESKTRHTFESKLAYSF